MASFDYLIIGGGMTGSAAAQGIREIDPKGSIGIISAEDQRPYNRPPLTKKLWQGKPEDVLRRDLPQERLDFIPGCRVITLDPRQKELQDEAGHTYHYNRLLLATGGAPRQLPFAPGEILYYRTLADYRTVRGWTGKGARISVIGGGFIGSEIAAALAGNGEQVVMTFPEAGIGARIYPADLSQYITNYFKAKGVEIHTGTEITGVAHRQGDGYAIQTKAGQEIAADRVIAGIGIRPNTELAQAAGINLAGPEAGGGILVDAFLRTSQPDIYAAGDVASFYNPVLQRYIRVEHADNADTMGRTAGLNMAGQDTPYHHQPFFYSDLFDLGYEAVGDLDARLETYADWKEPYRQGVVYYIKERKVRGVLLWNTWDRVDAARQMIADGREYQKEALKGKL